MIGAIAGDIIGSRFEFNNYKGKDFKLFNSESAFTDDTVLTIAIADVLMNSTFAFSEDIADSLYHWGSLYPGYNYGSGFGWWLLSKDRQPYNSFGNGAAMRVSPVGFIYDTLSEVLLIAEQTAKVTHNHPEGIKGAQATASAICLARQGETKEYIKEYIVKTFGYDLDRKLDDIRPVYRFNETCQGTVPEAIIAFMESVNYEDAIRNAISIGGDSDTLACITGGIAQAYYNYIPDNILKVTKQCLTEPMLGILHQFQMIY